MQIEIQLFASLRCYLPDGDGAAVVQMEVPGDATVGWVLDSLRVPREAAKLIFVNHLRAQLGQTLRTGDRMGVFPPVAGG